MQPLRSAAERAFLGDCDERPHANLAQHERSFGTAPPRFAGRHELVAEVIGRLGRGPGRYEFHTVIVGARGVGKTVLLAEIATIVGERGSGAVRVDS